MVRGQGQLSTGPMEGGGGGGALRAEEVRGIPRNVGGESDEVNVGETPTDYGNGISVGGGVMSCRHVLLYAWFRYPLGPGVDPLTLLYLRGVCQTPTTVRLSVHGVTGRPDSYMGRAVAAQAGLKMSAPTSRGSAVTVERLCDIT